MVVAFGFLVDFGAFGFFVGFGGLGFLVGFGGLGFLVGLGAFCFFALASFSAAFFALASERRVNRVKTFSYLKPVCIKEGMRHKAAFKHFIVLLYELLLPNVSI